MDNKKILNVIGFVVFFFWILLTIIEIYNQEFSAPFWFCNFSLALLALACFERSTKLLYVLLATALIFETPWIIDWCLFFLTDYSIFGMDTFYAGMPLYYFVLTFVRHLLAVPLMIVMLYYFEPKKLEKKYYLIWFVALVFLMVVSFMIGIGYNVNCAYYPCAGIIANYFSGFFYMTVWTLIIFVVSVISLRFIIIPVHKKIMRIGQH